MKLSRSSMSQSPITSTNLNHNKSRENIVFLNPPTINHGGGKISFGQSLKRALRFVDVEVNRHCNLKCSYCPNSTNPESTVKKIINPDLFKKILTDLKNMKFSGKMSYHFYGEPLLHPNLENFVEMTKQSLPNVMSQIFTNGTLLSTKRLQSLLSAGVDKVILTQHYKNNPFLKNLPNIPDNMLKNVDIKFPEEMILSNRSGIMDNVVRPTALSDSRCRFISNHMTITIEGDVLPCCDDYKRQNVMGNVNNNSISEIWNSESYAKFREELAVKGNRDYAEICKNCNRTDEHSVRHSAISVKENLLKKKN